MQTIYKVFLIIFILFLGINLYAIQWHLGFMNDENTKYIFSIAAALLGILLVFVLNTWSKLKVRQ